MSSGLSRLLPIAGLLSLVAPAASAAAVSKVATGNVALLSPLTVLKRTDLDFGTLVVTGAGTAVVDPVSGTRTATGGVVPAGTAAHPATFTATGNRNSVVNIRLPKGAITVTRVGGTQTMTVSNWTLDGNTNRKVPTTQTIDFAIGATLNVGANQTPGVYSGTFSVTVQYP
jgi:hypothetical protein